LKVYIDDYNTFDVGGMVPVIQSEIEFMASGR